MKILRDCVDAMTERARLDVPNETCGFFTGLAGVIEQIHPMKNTAAHPRTRYEFEPLEHFKFLKRMDRECVPILGVYHSHPASEAYPSQTDVDRAMLPDGTPTYSDYVYLILSLADASPVIRAFRIRQGGIIVEEDLLTAESRR